MKGSTDKGLMRGAARDRVVDLADDHLVTTDLEVQAGVREALMPAPLDVRRVDHRLGVVLTLGGELDLATVPLLQEQLDLAMRGRAAVVIDLAGLKFIDSSGLRMLVRAQQCLSDSGRQLVLVRGGQPVHRLFELTGLDSHFKWCGSASAALPTALNQCVGGPADPPADAIRVTAAELDSGRGGVTRP
jgi:anti-anti-sigma factor